MTPIQLAAAECANYVDGTCVVRNGCLLADRRRCEYFEASVLPLGDNAALTDYRAFRDAAALYRSRHTIKGRIGAEARLCDCGEPLQPRKRRCQACAKARRRESVRAAVRRARFGEVARNQSTAKNTP